jgi:hypothetical protein
MQKLTLDLESITVESFDATATGAGRAPGTVRAHDAGEQLPVLRLRHLRDLLLMVSPGSGPIPTRSV